MGEERERDTEFARRWRNGVPSVTRFFSLIIGRWLSSLYCIYDFHSNVTYYGNFNMRKVNVVTSFYINLQAILPEILSSIHHNWLTFFIKIGRGCGNRERSSRHSRQIDWAVSGGTPITGPTAIVSDGFLIIYDYYTYNKHHLAHPLVPSSFTTSLLFLQRSRYFPGLALTAG